MTTPQPLFLAGVGRSGTTALADLFSAHPEVAIGMERFKYLYKDPTWLTPEILTRERFFAFDEGDTNIRPDVHQRWRDYYDALEAKWDGVRYAGDKITHLNFPPIWRALPDTRIVCIVRDIRATAASWAARAANPKDVHWPERRGARTAVGPWNQGLRSISLSYLRRPDQVMVLEYDRLYGDPEAASLRRVLDRLGLGWGPEIDDAFARAHRRYVTSVKPKDRTLPPDDDEFIARRADFDEWQEILSYAL